MSPFRSRLAASAPFSLHWHHAKLSRTVHQPIDDLLNRRFAGREALVPDDLDRVVEDHLQPPVARRELDHLEHGALGDRLIVTTGGKTGSEFHGEFDERLAG